MPKVLLVNGPNLNLLATREPELYGTVGLAEIEQRLVKFFAEHKIKLVCFQSNHEGRLIDFIQGQLDADATIINPGGLTHNSVSLRDALCTVNIPFIEVHITNIYAREPARQHSVLSAAALGVICGFGHHGYDLAAHALLSRLDSR